MKHAPEASYFGVGFSAAIVRWEVPGKSEVPFDNAWAASPVLVSRLTAQTIVLSIVSMHSNSAREGNHIPSDAVRICVGNFHTQRLCIIV